MKQLLYILTFLFCTFSVAQNNALFDEANTFYNNGKYAEAIQKYEAVLTSGQHSAEVYFNLGNAHYKLNHIAPSIFYYEKALQLSPKDEAIENNLTFAKNMTIDAIDTVPEIGLSKFVRKAINTFGFDVWAIISVSLMILFVVLFLMYYFTHLTNKKRITFIASLTSIFFACLALAFAFQKYAMDNKDKPAIVFAQEAQVRTDPNLSGEESFRLHEGTKVQVLDTISNWKQIQLTDGKTGWIVSDEIKEL